MLEKVVEGAEAKELSGQDVETMIVHVTIQVNENYDESDIETVTGRRDSQEYLNSCFK